MDKKMAVFTTKQVVGKFEPISIVIHDADGEWQFLSGRNVTMEDMMIITLEQILAVDSSIEEILNIDQGKRAHRFNDDVWEVEDYVSRED